MKDKSKQTVCAVGISKKKNKRCPTFLRKIMIRSDSFTEVLFKELRGYDNCGDKRSLRMRCHCWPSECFKDSPATSRTVAKYWQHTLPTESYCLMPIPNSIPDPNNWYTVSTYRLCNCTKKQISIVYQH